MRGKNIFRCPTVQGYPGEKQDQAHNTPDGIRADLPRAFEHNIKIQPQHRKQIDKIHVISEYSEDVIGQKESHEGMNTRYQTEQALCGKEEHF